MKSSGPVEIEFTVEVNEPLTILHAGISLHSPENQLICDTAHDINSLEPGVLDFVYNMGGAPPEASGVPLADHPDRRAKMLDVWDCSPDFLIDTEPLGHTDEKWAGLLNVPNEFEIYDQNGTMANVRAIRGRIWTSIRIR